MLHNLRSSINPSTAQRAAKGLGVVQKVCTQFMADNNFNQNKGFLNFLYQKGLGLSHQTAY